MANTTVVLVHGFNSDPECWDPMANRLAKDEDLVRQGFRFVRFGYPTKVLEMKGGRRIPSIDECGLALRDFLKRQPRSNQLFLVGHSMGGLVIQSYLSQTIQADRGRDLARIRAVILFATPNRGSTFLGAVRSILSAFWTNAQGEGLEVLDSDIAKAGDVIARSIIGANSVDDGRCPIPFRVFWGLQDGIVSEVSARGSFVEASPLPGDHSEIIRCDPDKADDERYLALRDSLLNPPGHPKIFEFELFEVKLEVSPVPPGSAFTLQGEVRPLSIQTDNVAIRTIRIVVSEQNRCEMPYQQMYRSDDGLVELLSLTKPNEAEEKDKSTYYQGGQIFSYVFTPDRGREYSIKLRIYNGFGEGRRTWHEHMKQNARCKLFRFVLNLKAYHDAGYSISAEPTMYFYPQDTGDHTLCANRVGADPLPGLPSEDPWLRTWEIPNVQGGVIDLVWDVARVEPSPV